MNRRERFGWWLAGRCVFWRCLYWLLFVDHSIEFSEYRTGAFLLRLSAQISLRRAVIAGGFWFGWWGQHFQYASEMLADAGWSDEMISRNFRSELRAVRL